MYRNITICATHLGQECKEIWEKRPSRSKFRYSTNTNAVFVRKRGKQLYVPFVYRHVSTVLDTLLPLKSCENISKLDKFLSEWATFECLSDCWKCLGRRCSTAGIKIHIHNVFARLTHLTYFLQKRKKIRVGDCVFLFALLCLHNLMYQYVLARKA